MNVLTALGYSVFERPGDGLFRPSDPAPDWLPAGPLETAFPFLEVFLPDAEEFWADPGDRSALYSDLWTQNELHFGAIAITGDQKFLLIECAERRFHQMQQSIQYAHEASLARDQVAKLNEAKTEFLAR